MALYSAKTIRSFYARPSRDTLQVALAASWKPCHLRPLIELYLALSATRRAQWLSTAATARGRHLVWRVFRRLQHTVTFSDADYEGTLRALRKSGVWVKE